MTCAYLSLLFYFMLCLFLLGQAWVSPPPLVVETITISPTSEAFNVSTGTMFVVSAPPALGPPQMPHAG